jgi:hypothetical protein
VTWIAVTPLENDQGCVEKLAVRRDEDAANFGLVDYGTSIRCLLGIACRRPEAEAVLLLADCWQGVDHEVSCWRKTTVLPALLWLEGKTVVLYG